LHIHTPICLEDSSKTTINNRNYISRTHSVKHTITRLYKKKKRPGSNNTKQEWEDLLEQPRKLAEYEKIGRAHV
jgi:hypothetical protein